MYTLEKEDRQRVTVASEIQKSAFLACGWKEVELEEKVEESCLLYTSPSPRD